MTGAQLFDGLRVIELADDPAGELTGKLLAQMGATVRKYECPGGARSRHTGPYAGAEPDLERSLSFWHYNVGKQSVEARPTQEQLAGSVADLLITTMAPAELSEAGLDLDELTRAAPDMIVVSVTPFGLTGPWADRLSCDLVGLAAGGLLVTSGYDDHGLPPIRPGGDQAYNTAAAFALLGALLALVQRQVTGIGGIVDVSMHDACAVSPEQANMYWDYARVLVQRQTCRHAQPRPTQPATFLCADGRYVYLALILGDLRGWRSLVAWMDGRGLAVDLTDDRYLELTHRQANFAHIQGLLEVFFVLQSATEAYHDGQRHGLAIGILNAPEDLLDDEHLRERDYFVTVDQPGVGPVHHAGVPFRFSTIPGVTGSPAPALGTTRAGTPWT